MNTDFGHPHSGVDFPLYGRASFTPAGHFFQGFSLKVISDFSCSDLFLIFTNFYPVVILLAKLLIEHL